jgi:hypothetical protein
MKLRKEKKMKKKNHKHYTPEEVAFYTSVVEIIIAIDLKKLTLAQFVASVVKYAASAGEDPEAAYNMSVARTVFAYYGMRI